MTLITFGAFQVSQRFAARAIKFVFGGQQAVIEILPGAALGRAAGASSLRAAPASNGVKAQRLLRGTSSNGM